MIEFNEYQHKPVATKAYQIKADDIIEPIGDHECKGVNLRRPESTLTNAEGESLTFRHDASVSVDDWIIDCSGFFFHKVDGNFRHGIIVE